MALGVLIAFLALRYLGSAEYQIRSSIERAAHEAEEERIEGVMSEVSAAFRGFGGAQAGLESSLRQSVVEGGWSSISLVTIDVTLVSETEADAIVCASFRGNKASEQRAGFEGLYEASISFRKENDGKWRADEAGATMIQAEPAMKPCR